VQSWVNLPIIREEVHAMVIFWTMYMIYNLTDGKAWCWPLGLARALLG
jgi:hypothetical protein